MVARCRFSHQRFNCEEDDDAGDVDAYERSDGGASGNSRRSDIIQDLSRRADDDDVCERAERYSACRVADACALWHMAFVLFVRYSRRVRLSLKSAPPPAASVGRLL